MTARYVWVKLEHFCTAFARGFGANIQFVQSLITDRSNVTEIQTPPEKSPERTSVLAQRRAERQKAKGVVPRSTEEQIERPRTQLWKLMKKNLILLAVCLLGVSHGILPLIQRWFGVYWDSTAEWAVHSAVISLWLAPLWILVKVVNVFWMTDLASSAYRESRGRPAPMDMTVFFTDILFTTILQMLLILQTSVFSMIQLLIQGFNILELFMTAISYSLYAFEYKWMYMGYDVHRRLDLIDKNMGYHIGFGFPLAFLVLCSDNFWIRFVLYSVFFPALILSSCQANEPHARKGRSTYIFFLPEAVTRFSLRLSNRLIRKFGFKHTLYFCCFFCILYLMFWLGGLATMISILSDVDLKDHFRWLHQSVVAWFYE